ncbi:MAG: efflux RND transporter permease subunit, partial [Verrucomicrobia bacterium]|nr:efflux RND transporter permease subunit [Verrucomicrobiota bacterium]
LALFGIATDDGVLFATRLDQTFEEQKPKTREEIRAAVIDAASRRIRPALMTTATTLLALLPVMTSTGKGSDIMVPMALPAFGGMIVATLTVFVVPVLYAGRAEREISRSKMPKKKSVENNLANPRKL